MTRATFTPRRLLEELHPPMIDAPAAEVLDPCAGTGHWYLLATVPPVRETRGGEDAESSDLGRGGRRPGFGLMGIGIGLLFCILVAVTVALVWRLP